MRTILLKIYLIYCFALFLTAMVVLFPLMAWPVQLFGARGRKASYVGFRLWAGSFWLMGVRFAVHGREHLLPGGGVLYIANHQSLLDTPSIFWAVLRPQKPLGKIELARFPVFATLYRLSTVIVDRDNAGSRMASLAAMSREFAAGHSMAVFPEGRMNPDHTSVRPFQEGSIGAAMRQRAAIQPIALRGTGPLLAASGPFLIHPGRIEITILPAITAYNYEGATVAEITGRARGAIAATLGFELDERPR